MTLLAIGSDPRKTRMTRRRMLQLGAGVAAGAITGCGPQTAEQLAQAEATGIVPWPTDIRVPPVFSAGYGEFPDYDAIGTTGPWNKILSDRHKRQLEVFSDLILPATDTAPAPSQVGIAEFWDDWTSAPYPYMTDSRRIVHQGFAWLDRQMQRDVGTDWLGASDAQRRAQLDRMRDAAAAGDEGPLQPAAGMYTHLRKLVIGAYYTTPQGEADLGHITPEVTGEDYPGPTGEALEHILGIIEGLGLETADLPIGPPPYDVQPYSYTLDNPS